MRLVSVNVGRATAFDAKPVGKTGIFKEPVASPVAIGPLGLTGDAICDTENHGGPDQAVYIFGTPDYAAWSRDLATSLPPGTFGENLTITDLESANLSIGDRLHVGEHVILEITAPRIPCVTLARRMNDPRFLVRFRALARPGAYCRVIRPGQVATDQFVSLERYVGPTLTLGEMFEDFFAKRRDEHTLRRHLAAPIAIRDRIEAERRLRELTESGVVH